MQRVQAFYNFQLIFRIRKISYQWEKVTHRHIKVFIKPKILIALIDKSIIVGIKSQKLQFFSAKDNYFTAKM